jgi:hypothetical protein
MTVVTWPLPVLSQTFLSLHRALPAVSNCARILLLSLLCVKVAQQAIAAVSHTHQQQQRVQDGVYSLTTESNRQSVGCL